MGKTHAARELGNTYKNFVEINLEDSQKIRNVFTKDMDPLRMVRELSLIAGKPIVPGKTLLFLDEIQASPEAFLALRYFYEKLPELHVIAAGSLLNFTIKKIRIPVGRVMSLYMYPMTFLEFLEAMGRDLLHERSLPINRVSSSVNQYIINS